MIKFCVLGSGSGGNATYVEIDGKKILLDAGFSYSKLTEKLAGINQSITDIDYVFISHNHKDHIQALNKFKKSNPNAVITACPDIIHGQAVIDNSSFIATPFLLSHDDPCYGYRLMDNCGNALVYVPDTGYIPENVYPFLFDANAIILEFNHDVKMLTEGPYNVELQERIFGCEGHMNNEDAGDVLEGIAWSGLEYVVCFHLSRNCNHPDLARYEASRGLAGFSNCQVICARQDEDTGMMFLV
ncbi:MAG: MBL fold metallo-hydrolase [Thermodesulfobacteriota bacterium]|nr:MBL fold metallo-hydrolase [Thermodesulfobacteriota bacterium]